MLKGRWSADHLRRRVDSSTYNKRQATVHIAVTASFLLQRDSHTYSVVETEDVSSPVARRGGGKKSLPRMLIFTGIMRPRKASSSEKRRGRFVGDNGEWAGERLEGFDSL